MSTAQAWFMPCSICGGGMMWGLDMPEIYHVLEWTFRESGFPKDFFKGPRHQLSEMNYCRCDGWEKQGKPQPAWVIRCAQCTGGMMWGLQSPEIGNMIVYAFERIGFPEGYEEGNLDLLCEVEYCTCDEDVCDELTS